MALDHYVSQVYLKNFYSPALSDMMHGIQKRTLKKFRCRAADVCRIEEGNTNPFLEHSRAIEGMLREIEPRYNDSVTKIRQGKIDAECVFVIAGFISYVMSCSPSSQRQNSAWLAATVESTAKIMEEMGKLDPPPEILGGGSLTELIDKGVITIDIDPKYPQSLGVTGIIDRIVQFGNFQWDILFNEFDDSPYFTSDYPAAIEQSRDPRVQNRVFPLAPDIAVRIHPDPNIQVDRTVLSFPHFRSRSLYASKQDVRAVNQAIVRSAEEVVFFRDDRPWVVPFVKKNAEYWVESSADRIPHNGGELIWSSIRLAKRNG